MPDPIRPGQVWQHRERPGDLSVTVEKVSPSPNGIARIVANGRGYIIGCDVLRARYRLISDPEETPDA